jgi:regulator of replication initiation timing
LKNRHSLFSLLKSLMDSNNNKRPRFSSSPPLSLCFKQDVITMDDITPTTSSGGLGGVTNNNTVVNDLEQKINTLTQEVEVLKGEAQEKKKEVDALMIEWKNEGGRDPFSKAGLLAAAQQAHQLAQQAHQTAIQERDHAEQQLEKLYQQQPGTYFFLSFYLNSFVDIVYTYSISIN